MPVSFGSSHSFALAHHCIAEPASLDEQLVASDAESFVVDEFAAWTGSRLYLGSMSASRPAFKKISRKIRGCHLYTALPNLEESFTYKPFAVAGTFEPAVLDLDLNVAERVDSDHLLRVACRPSWLLLD